MKQLILSLFLGVLPFLLHGQCSNLYIGGAIDGPLSGGTPKALQLCTSGPIADLSIYGIETVTDGDGSTGIEYTFPPDALNAGDCIWVTTGNTSFNDFFGFTACYESFEVSNNGDDSFILYCNGAIVDVLGDPNTDGTGQTWEYLDGWVAANDAVPNPVFNDAEWIYSGVNALDNEMTNAAAVTPYPNAIDNCSIAPVCDITDVSINGNCSGSSYVVFVSFVTSNGSGTYDVVDVTNGNAILGSGMTSPIIVTLTNNASTTPFDIIVVDNGNPACNSFSTTINPINCASFPTCPGAYISEFAYDCDENDANEVIEVAIPNSYAGSLADLQIDLYNGVDSLVYNILTLDNFSIGTNDGTFTYYTWAGSGASIQNGPYDGLALSFQGTPCEFISYEGAITVLDGPAVGQTSNNVGVNQTNVTPCSETIQLINGTWFNSCATVGDVNSTAACIFDCPDFGNIGDSCNDGNPATNNDTLQTDCTCLGTLNPCFPDNIGSSCNDFNSNTLNDIIQADCSCSGTAIGLCPAGFINEFHYDNVGNDVNEFIEIAIPNGGDPTQILITLYRCFSNGFCGVYGTYYLSSVDFVSSDANYDYYVWNTSIQNGPDGIALSCLGGGLLQFITYEGSFTVSNGPASGATSIDIGVSEGTPIQVGESLQFDGSSWSNGCAATPGTTNDLSTCYSCPTAFSNVGDVCDDGDLLTTGETIQADCSCGGGMPLCLDTLYVPGSMTVIPSELYQANQVVTSDGQVVIGDTVTFHGGNYVELLPEFDVPLNCQFSISINPCGVAPIPKPIKNERQ